MNEQHTDNLSPLKGEALRNYIEDTYRALEKEPVLHQWDISHKNPHRWLVSGIVFFIFIVLAYVTGTTGEYGANTSLWFFSLFAVFGGGYVRFLLLPDNMYDYHLTSKGIYYTQQDNIPDIAFTIARGLGWFGCGVCVLAAGMLGPAAFIGAGASALLAWKIKDMQPTAKKHVCLYKTEVDSERYIKLWRKKHACSIMVNPFRPYNEVELYCLSGELDKVIKLILPYLDSYEVQEANSWREFSS